jgi:hypothetical protein
MYVGSDPAEADGYLRAIKISQHALLRVENKAVTPFCKILQRVKYPSVV